MMSFVAQTLATLLAALPLTVAIALAAAAAGGALAVPLALALGSRARWLRLPAAAYVGLVRGTPALLQLYLVYYGLPQFAAVREGVLWPLLREPAACAILTLALHHAGYLATVFAGAIAAVPRGEVDAACAFGLHGWTLHRRVVAPHALRVALPAWGNEAVSLLKTSALCSTITLVELTGTAAIVASESFRPFVAFALAGALYLAMTTLLSGLFALAERRLAPSRESLP